MSKSLKIGNVVTLFDGTKAKVIQKPTNYIWANIVTVKTLTDSVFYYKGQILKPLLTELK